MRAGFLLATLSAIALCTVALRGGGVRAQDDVCAQAEARYVELKGAPSAGANPPVVLLYNYTFCPRELRAKAGSVIRFVNVDKRTSHSVWFKAAGKAESERFFPGEHADVTLDLASGPHEVLCGPHWEHQNMRGHVVVTP
jgi:plastocyanin